MIKLKPYKEIIDFAIKNNCRIIISSTCDIRDGDYETINWEYTINKKTLKSDFTNEMYDILLWFIKTYGNKRYKLKSWKNDLNKNIAKYGRELILWLDNFIVIYCAGENAHTLEDVKIYFELI